jgi:hypothetical protein
MARRGGGGNSMYYKGAVSPSAGRSGRAQTLPGTLIGRHQKSAAQGEQTNTAQPLTKYRTASSARGEGQSGNGGNKRGGQNS